MRDPESSQKPWDYRKIDDEKIFKNIEGEIDYIVNNVGPIIHKYIS